MRITCNFDEMAADVRQICDGILYCVAGINVVMCLVLNYKCTLITAVESANVWSLYYSTLFCVVESTCNVRHGILNYFFHLVVETGMYC